MWLMSSIIGLFFLTFVSSDVILTPESPSAMKQTNMTLTCTYTGNETLSLVTWYIVKAANENKGAILFSSCTTFGLPINASQYQYNCDQSSLKVNWIVLNIQVSNDKDVWVCTATTSSSVIYSNSVTIAVEDPCVCNCSCTFDGGKIAFTVIDYLLDVVYTIVVVWLTFECAKVWKPEVLPKDAILVLSTLAVVLLDIGYTILLFLCKNDDSDDCKPECKEECGCCTHSLRLGLTVGAWLLDVGGYGMIGYYIYNRVVEGKGPKASTPASPARKPQGSVKPAGGHPVDKTPQNKHFTPDGRDQGHARNDGTKNGGNGRPQPPPPQASSREDSTSEVSRQDVTLDVEKRPLPDIGGGGMGKRGLSANFEDNGDMTPMEGRVGQRLPTLKPLQASIAENDETEKKKKRKKKKRKTDDNDGTEMD